MLIMHKERGSVREFLRTCGTIGLKVLCGGE